MVTENIFQQQLLRESVFADRNLMSAHYVPEKLPFRERQITEISEILAVALQGKRPNNVFIYGKVGTGKTATCRNVLQQLLDFAEQRNMPVKGCYINCRNHNSRYKVMLKIVSQFYPEQNFMGFSAAFVHEKLMEFANKGSDIVVILDEIDKVKDLDELVYSLSRANDELKKGSVSIVGISNNLLFKERLDVRSKSSLCEHEMVFPAYNADELSEILRERALQAFKPEVVDSSAIFLSAAIAAKESGDARKAVLLLLRAGEMADKEHLQKVTEAEVEKAKKSVEEEIILNMISTLPSQQKLVLAAVAKLTLDGRGIQTVTGEREEGLLYSGEVYNTYCKIARQLKEQVVSARWYREYISELETYGLLLTTNSGKGIKGQTRLIKLAFEADKIKGVIEKEIRG